MPFNNLTEEDLRCATEGCLRPRSARVPQAPSGFLCAPCRAREWKTQNKDRWDESHRRYVNKRRNEARDVLNAYKLAAGCVDCGYAEHAVALDFDHLPGFEKSLDLCAATARGWPMSRIMEEVAKCEVVCANCHRVRTLERRIEEVLDDVE